MRQEGVLENLVEFFSNFVKFAIGIFTGTLIVVSIVWFIGWLIEKIVYVVKHLFGFIQGEDYILNKETKLINDYYRQHGIRCSVCRMWVPDVPICPVCGYKREEKKLINSKIDTDSTETTSDNLSINQYFERKKHQKIRCPWCKTLSKIVEEPYKGHQVRECRNGHLFIYDYEGEMIIQEEPNYKFK